MLPKPEGAFLLDMRQVWGEKHRMLPKSGKWPVIPAAERRAGAERWYLSNKTGNIIG